MVCFRAPAARCWKRCRSTRAVENSGHSQHEFTDVLQITVLFGSGLGMAGVENGKGTGVAFIASVMSFIPEPALENQF